MSVNRDRRVMLIIAAVVSLGLCLIVVAGGVLWLVLSSRQAPVGSQVSKPATRRPAPTFTPTQPPPTFTPWPTRTPTPTPEPTLAPNPAQPESPVNTPVAVAAAQPSTATTSQNLRVRSGPGTEYRTLGSLAANSTVTVIGKNAEGTWWQIQYDKSPDGKAWISAKYAPSNNAANVPVVEAPPTPSIPPTPTPPPAPPPTPTPEYQFSPAPWEGQWNAGLAQIRGKIKDTAGNPVKGYFVQAKCGGTVLASNPSGVNLYAPEKGYEPGAYDIILSSPLSPDSMCNWEVRVVDAANYEAAKDPNARSLSPVGYCDLSFGEMSICFANWTKNW